MELDWCIEKGNILTMKYINLTIQLTMELDWCVEKGTSLTMKYINLTCILQVKIFARPLMTFCGFRQWKQQRKRVTLYLVVDSLYRQNTKQYNMPLPSASLLYVQTIYCVLIIILQQTNYIFLGCRWSHCMQMLI